MPVLFPNPDKSVGDEVPQLKASPLNLARSRLLQQ